MNKDDVRALVLKVIGEYEETEEFEIENSEDSHKLATCLKNYLYKELDSQELFEFYNTYQKHYGEEDYLYENNSWDIGSIFNDAWEGLQRFHYYESSDEYFRLYPQTETLDYIPIEEIFVEIFISVLKDAILQEEDRVYDFNIIDLYLNER